MKAVKILIRTKKGEYPILAPKNEQYFDRDLPQYWRDRDVAAHCAIKHCQHWCPDAEAYLIEPAGWGQRVYPQTPHPDGLTVRQIEEV